MALVAILSVVLVFFAEVTKGTNSCVDRTNFEMETMLDRLRAAPQVDANAEVSTIPARYNQTLRFKYGPSQCPTAGSVTYELFQSGCHFHYLLNHDKNRIPNVVVERRCSCSDNANRKEDCVTTKKKRNVYRRIDCKDGFYVYNMTVEEFDEGCERRLNVQIPREESPKSPEGEAVHDSPKSPPNPLKLESPKSPVNPLENREDSPKSPL